MIINEKQIMQLITIANAYIATLHKLGTDQQSMIEMQCLLDSINDQPSEELKVIE